MKKMFAASALAVCLALASQQQASAWVNSKLAVGLSWDMSCGNNSMGWGLFSSGQTPNPYGMGGDPYMGCGPQGCAPGGLFGGGLFSGRFGNGLGGPNGNANAFAYGMQQAPMFYAGPDGSAPAPAATPASAPAAAPAPAPAAQNQTYYSPSPLFHFANYPHYGYYPYYNYNYGYGYYGQ
jgi:hypothetical protein